MELFEAIKGRRSVRSYKEQDVPEETVDKLVEAASWAPSAGNLQPWVFVVVRNPVNRSALAEAAGQAFVGEAPAVIVVCANEERSSMGYGFRGKALFCIQDTAAAIQNVLLSAYSFGLGTCWVGTFNEDEVRKAIRAPLGMRPVAILPLGYANGAVQPRRRRPVGQILVHESF